VSCVVSVCVLCVCVCCECVLCCQSVCLCVVCMCCECVRRHENFFVTVGFTRCRVNPIAPTDPEVGLSTILLLPIVYGV